MKSFVLRDGPQRIICLTEETTELLYLLGEEHRIVGISAYTVRPPEAKEQKPVVSAFINGSLKKIAALSPDLIIGFSDIQAQLAHDLIKAHLPVLIFNQRSVQEILNVIVELGSLVNKRQAAEELVSQYIVRIEALKEISKQRSAKPKVYFEEWDDPMICGIRWVSELIEIAGGTDIFAHKRGPAASQRFVTMEEVKSGAPDIVLGCWCGKPFDKASFVSRPGAVNLPAVKSGQIFELAPEIMLQPGPAALTEGLDRLIELFQA